MTTRAASVCIALLVATIAGCSDGHGAGVAVDTPDARRLDGSWTIELHADRLRLEPVAAKIAQALTVRGEIALVSNHWLGGGGDSPRPSQYGTYDIDFSALGFDPRHGGELPRATARIVDGDSVALVLEPDDAHESVNLRGAARADSIVGRWSVEPVRAGADAAGTFSMTRRTHP